MFGILTLPLGLHIPSGVKVSIDDKLTYQPKLIDCGLEFCRAIFSVSHQILDAYKKGWLANVVIVDSKTQKKLLIKYGLSGFTQAFNQFKTKAGF